MAKYFLFHNFVPMTLHVFNPENDLALACFEPHFIPPRSARMMAEELSVLPFWWAEEGEAVCVYAPAEAQRWVERMHPGMCSRVRWLSRSDCSGVTRIQPWGWSPMLVTSLMRGGCSAEVLPDKDSLLRYRDRSNRCHAVGLLHSLTAGMSELCREWKEYLCGTSFYCTDEEYIVRLLDKYPETILKAPWSGSGKGLRLGRTGFVPPLSGWCRRLLREQGGVVVEPLYNKVYDFALEFEADGKGNVTYRGLSVFFTTHQGAYSGNWVAGEEVKEQWLEQHLPVGMFRVLRRDLSKNLGRILGDYDGPLGVDMMLCRIPGVGHLCVHPCVEINLRRTMGLVSVDLARWLAPGAEGRFVVDYSKDPGTLFAECRQLAADASPQWEDGRLVAGCLVLTPVTEHTHYRAMLQVGRQFI